MKRLINWLAGKLTIEAPQALYTERLHFELWDFEMHEHLFGQRGFIIPGEFSDDR